MVQAGGTSALDNLEKVGDKLQHALNQPDVTAYAELGWEFWQVLPLNDVALNTGPVIGGSP